MKGTKQIPKSARSEKFFETEHFEKLQTIWKQKLADSGFTDIELADGSLLIEDEEIIFESFRNEAA